MGKTKKYIVAIIVALITLSIILLMMLVNLYIGNNETINDSSKITISILNSWGDTSDKNSVLAEVLNSYTKANPNTLINNTSLNYDDFYLSLQTDFASANEPDIIITYADRNIKNLYNANKLAIFNEALAEDPDWETTLRKDALTHTTDKGNVWGIPTDIEYIALYTNTDLFNTYSIPIPKTMSELKYAVSVFRSNGITPIAFSAKDKNLLMYQAIVSSLSGRIELNEAISRTGSRECYARGLQILKELYSINSFPKNSDAITQAEAQNLFLSGEAAMIVETSSFVGIADRYSSSNIHFSISAFPAIHETRYRVASKQTYYNNTYPSYCLVPYSVGSSTFFISKRAYETKKEEVLNLVKHLTSPNVSRQFYAKTKYISSINDTYLPTKNGSLITERNLLVNNADEFTDLPQNGTDHFIWYNMISSEIYKVLTGTISPEELWNSAEQALNIIER